MTRLLHRSAGRGRHRLGHGLLGANNASAQTRTIRIVVPFAPAGGTTIVARLLADPIGRVHGPTMVVENRPGAGTVIATEYVSRAAPDGNTVLMVGNSFVINPNMKKLSYDPLTSFEPICQLTTSPNIVAVHAAARYRTLADLVEAARAAARQGDDRRQRSARPPSRSALRCSSARPTSIWPTSRSRAARPR